MEIILLILTIVVLGNVGVVMKKIARIEKLIEKIREVR